MNPPLQIPKELLDDYDWRREMAKTFKGFLLVYLPHYLTLPPGIFADDLITDLSNPLERFLDITGFRGSAKSTLGSLGLPLWMALVNPEVYPFIIPIADTGLQSGLNIANIKEELDNNLLIKQDFGSIKGEFVADWTLESEEEWQAKNMLLSNGVRILGRSRGQKVRGLRHKQHRPKVVIVDDPEDLDWVAKKENRDKTERWLKGEVIPGIDPKVGRLIVIGNMLSNDALMARLRKNPLFKHIEIPLIKQEDGKKIYMWPAMFGSDEEVDKLKQAVGPVSFQREYMLKAVQEEGQPVKEEWIQYYDLKPAEADQGMRGVGVDLAISKRETADYTTMVDGTICFINGQPRIYIEPYPVNDRLSFYETIETAKAKSTISQGMTFFVEDVAYQRAAIEEMQRNLLAVVPMKATTDKRARLLSVAPYIQNGTVQFARIGNEDLIIQLLGFGIEAHDDLVDGLVDLISGLIKNYIQNCEVIAL